MEDVTTENAAVRGGAVALPGVLDGSNPEGDAKLLADLGMSLPTVAGSSYVPTVPLGQLFERYAEKRAEHEALQEKADVAKLAMNKLTDHIRMTMEAQGMGKDGSKVAGAGFTATYKVKYRAQYEPAEWGNIIQWAADQGRTDIVQRRMNDAPILELFDAGAELPPGVKISSFNVMEIRANRK
jgi:hypothetical protein